MSDIAQKEHEAWWRGFKVGTENAIDVIKHHLTENPNMSMKDLILRIKVSVINMKKS